MVRAAYANRAAGVNAGAYIPKHADVIPQHIK
jgi:hypothetical protein